MIEVISTTTSQKKPHQRAFSNHKPNNSINRSSALKHTEDKSFKDDQPKTGRLTLTIFHRLYI
jgi:hypothetical protein